MTLFQTNAAYFKVHTNGDLTRITCMPLRPGKKNGYARSTVVSTAKAIAWQESQSIL
jgi:hypothetical protein